MDAAHEIFRTPFAVTPTLTPIDVPDNYRRYREGAELPATIPGWRVHDELPSRDVGLVSDPYGFTDSPDCEFIASGINSKGPRSVALGRQGNFFLWGFCAPPASLTDEAETVFLNTLVYMKRFDRQRPLHEKMRRAREWLVQYAFLLKDQEASDYLIARIDKDLLTDRDGMLARVERELDYVWCDGDVFRIDADCKELGIPNRDARLLDACAEALERDANDARAQRLLRRYVGQDLGSAAAWREWIGTNRARLYFSDTAGYRWFVAPAGR